MFRIHNSDNLNRKLQISFQSQNIQAERNLNEREEIANYITNNVN